MRNIGIAALLLIAFCMFTQHSPAQSSHWQLTESETLWTERYSNCQYGYYFLLPTDVVAHAEHPPSPHHGFLIKLPATAVRTEVTFDNSDRLIWATAEYNVTEASTLKGVAEYEMEVTGSGKRKFKLIEHHAAKLQSRPAIEFRAEYDTADGLIVEDVLIALHSGVVYELGLKTTPERYEADRAQFQKLITGFRFTPIAKGECWHYW